MTNIWTNPPGFLYGFSYAIAGLGYSFYIRRSSLKKPERIMSFVIGIALIAFMIMTENPSKPLFLICVAVEVLMVYGIMYFGNEMSWKKNLYYTAHTYIIGEFCASLTWQLYFYIYMEKGRMELTPGRMCLLLSSMLIVYIVVFFIEKKIYNPKFDVEITEREAITVVVIAAVVYAMSNISYVSNDTPFSSTLPREIFIIHTLVDLGGVAIFFAYHIQLTELQRRIDYDNMKNILDMQNINYQVSKQSVDIINQKYHDLKHQIDILRREFGSEKGLQYLDKMESEIEAYEAQNKTGNKILDTILTGKSLYCQQYGIRLTGVADGSLLSFMDMMDISSLFGNAFDNAIESVMAFEDGEQRLIHFTISRNKGFVRIKIENRYAGTINIKDGLPQTTKKDRNYHGYGIKSIKTVVKKYNGSVTIDARDGWFELRILIPLRES